MLRDITIGQYYPSDSPIHRLDPRTKLVITFLFIIIIFFVRYYTGYLFILAFLALIVILSGIPVKYILKGLRPLLFIILLTFFINIFFTAGETTLFSVWFIRVTKEGLRQAFFMTLRLVFLVVGTSLLTLTTSPISLTDGIESLLRPLRVIKFPSHELAMMMTIALRFIPTLLNETERIMKAQIARGAELERGGPLRRLRAFIPVLVPLFVIVFQRADDLATAMEARNYSGGEGRTRMNPLKWTARDTVALVFSLLFSLSAVLLDGRVTLS